MENSERLLQKWKRGELTGNVDSVSEQHDLCPAFVAPLVAGLTDPCYTRTAYRNASRGTSVWKRFTENPIRLPAVTLVLVTLLLQFNDALQLLPQPASSAVSTVLTVLAAVSVLILCLASYQRASIAYTLKLSGVCVVGMSVTMGLSVLFSANAVRMQNQPMGKGVQVLFGLLGGVFLGLLLSAIFFGLTALGGVFQMRKSEKQRLALSRQQLLERLFDIRDRISAASSTTRRRTMFDSLFARKIIQFSPIIVGVTMVASSLLDKIARTLPEMDGIDSGRIVLLGSLSFVSLLLLTIVPLITGFFTRNAGRAVLLFLLGELVLSGMDLLPLSSGKIWSFNHLVAAIGRLMLYGIGAIVGIMTQTRIENDQLEQNDHEALVREQAELEAMLRPVKRRVCVLVIDAAGSSRMKANADPFVAEWSFREYQSWIARVCERHLGTVHATAGDGAVVGFSDCENALKAAMELQATLPIFNERVNRIPAPFLIRIGLHAGEIEGELDKVQFTEVIDIAAHVEGKTPIGRIGATQLVTQECAYEFVVSEAETDGYQVFLLQGACGPTH